MELQFDEKLEFRVNGVLYRELTKEQKDNVRLRIASYIRTHPNDEMVQSISATLVAMLGTDGEPKGEYGIKPRYWEVDNRIFDKKCPLNVGNK